MASIFENIDNSSELANDLFAALTAGIVFPTPPDFSDPKFDYDPSETDVLYQDIDPATIAEVTENDLEGEGAFDVFMSSMDKHLEREFLGNRITGSQYAQAYTSIAVEVIGQAVGFVLQKDRARWEAITAQMQARVAEIEATKALIDLERVKFEAINAQFDMNLTAAQYGLTKMQIASEEANHDSITADVAIKQFERNYMLPANLAIKHYERTDVLPTEVALQRVQADRILPAQAESMEIESRLIKPLEAQIKEIERDRIIPTQADIEEFKRDHLLPLEKAQQQHILNARQPAETEYILEQIESERANTLDTRRDGMTPIEGILKYQKALMKAQSELAAEQMEGERAKTMDTRSDGITLVEGVTKTQKDLTIKQQELIDSQIGLTDEQMEAERAKTLDIRTDSATVMGSVGKQKDLYSQQIESFIRDAEHKTAKMYLDGWITQKTLDEGLNAPSELVNTEVSQVLAAVRAANNLD